MALESGTNNRRRNFLKASIYVSSAALTAGVFRLFRPQANLAKELTSEALYEMRDEFLKRSILDFSAGVTIDPKDVTSLNAITNYNNFYEFSTDKEAVAKASSSWEIKDWRLDVGGLVENPKVFSLAEIQQWKQEDRVYRFRCVEGWSMIVPWRGFPLAKILDEVRPLAGAKYVAFESFFDDTVMPAASSAGIPFPYVEGLRLDEAMHPLTLLATGLYQKPLPNQNGAPIRLVVPWKYGFKSIKSVIKIRLLAEEPPTTWSLANPQEYGFYSNVNPEVDHPRWSQKQERRIGEVKLRETLMFNGYAKEVAHLYQGMDLRKYF